MANPNQRTPYAPDPLYDAINIKSLGVFSDWTGVIQHTLDKLHTAGGGGIYFPPGRYPTSASLTVYANTRIFGEGDLSVIAPRSYTFHVFTATGQDNIQVRDLTVEGTAVVADADPDHWRAFRFTGCSNCTFDNVTSTLTPGGIGFLATSAYPNCNYNKITNCTMDDVGYCGIEVVSDNDQSTQGNRSVKGNVISNNVCINNESDDGDTPIGRGYGIVVGYWAEENTITGNVCSGNSHHGIYLRTHAYNNVVQGNTVADNQGTGITLFWGPNGNIVDGNICENNATLYGEGNIAVQYSSTHPAIANVITNNICRNSVFDDQGTGDGGIGIYVRGAQRTIIKGNLCGRNGRAGIMVVADTGVVYIKDNLIEGNFCYDNDFSNTTGSDAGGNVTSKYAAGIVLFGASMINTVVRGNFCFCTDPTKYQKYGIWVHSTGTSGWIDDNYLLNNRTGGLKLESTSADILVGFNPDSDSPFPTARYLTGVGDGTTNDTAALQACLSQGGTWLGVPGKTYKVTSAITLVSNTTLDLQGATILQGAEASIFTATGTLGNDATFPSNIAKGAYTFNLAVGDGANWSAGDYIVLKSDDEDNAVTGEFTRALHRIKSVSTDTVVLYDTLDFPYTTAEGAEYAKMTPLVNITLKNMNVTNGNNSSFKGYLAQFNYCANITVENINAYDFGGGIQFTDVHTFTATDIKMRRVTDFSGAEVAFGYGILAAAGSCYGTITRFIAHDLRHCFTTIGWGNGTHSGPRYITIADSVGTATNDSDSTGIWDTHAGGYQITFRNCLAMGGSSVTGGWQLRCHHTNLYDCRAIHTGGRALSCSAGADYVIWDGGEVGWCGGAGSVSGANYFRLLNVYVHHSGSSSSGYGINGAYCEARGCTFEDNAAAGIVASSATSLAIIQGNTFIKGTNQGVCVESPSAVVQILDNQFSGYVGKAPIGSPNAATTILRNTGYKGVQDGEILVSSTAGVDMNVGTKTTLYTVPTNYSFIVTKIVVRNASASLTTASYSFGYDAGATNVIANATHTELTGNTLSTTLLPAVGQLVGSSTAVLGVLMNTLQGGAATTTMDVYGYFL
jgi:parallel beta-helix repeat protein